jgi:hypothetical protein
LQTNRPWYFLADAKKSLFLQTEWIFPSQSFRRTPAMPLLAILAGVGWFGQPRSVEIEQEAMYFA